MNLTELFDHIEKAQGIKAVISGQADVTGLCFDSRKAQKGDAFFCLPGTASDGHDYAAQAVARGAAAIVAQRRLPVNVPQALVPDTHAALSYASAAFYGYPARGMRMVGITGTKGKTTTSYLVKKALDTAGLNTGLLGTVSTMIGQKEVPGNLTTPDAPEFHRTLRLMRDSGVDTLVMEVSANAMALKRLAGVRFDVGVFTNFAQDHLDYFGTMQRYFEAKKMFMTPEMVDFGVINADDDMADAMAGDVPHDFYGIINQRGAFATDMDVTERGLAFTLCYENMVLPLRLGLSGLFNVYNAMAAAIACLKLGAGVQQVAEGLAAVKNVPGRIELLDTQTPYKVVLDYAHTPNSLENILSAVRQFTKGRLIVLFGCGGNRDHDKRPLMGEIAGRMADFSIITSDNPRTEEPMDIIRQIEEGAKRSGGEYTLIESREQAIYEGLKMARPGDTLILAGKGHEKYQDIGGEKRPFDEREVVARLLGGMEGEDGHA